MWMRRCRSAILDSRYRYPCPSEGDYSRPDRSQTSVAIDLAIVKFEMDVIVIGNDVYMTDPETGEWIRSDAYPDFMLIDPIDLAGSFQFLGIADFLGLGRPTSRRTRIR